VKIIQEEENAMNDSTSFSQRWADFRPSKAVWLWSCVACVVATMVVGFAWGGWTTGGTAAKMASDAADHAQAELAATVCVAKFMAAPDVATQLATLKKTDSWKREDLIQKGGWAKLTGLEKVPSDAADLCAEKLASMEVPAAKPVAETQEPAHEEAGG
jgi:hypothetical protein